MVEDDDAPKPRYRVEDIEEVGLHKTRVKLFKAYELCCGAYHYIGSYQAPITMPDELLPFYISLYDVRRMEHDS